MIPIEKWGKDHWGTFAYVGACCVDHGGYPDRRYMRCDADLHPDLVSPVYADLPPEKCPTRLNDGTEVANHDDWSCADDFEEAGFIESLGSDIYPRYRLTEKGKDAIAQLRNHKMDGGNFKNFRYES